MKISENRVQPLLTSRRDIAQKIPLNQTGKPGKDLCWGECDHGDCELQRLYAHRLCNKCEKPIGYNAHFKRLGTNFYHEECAERRIKELHINKQRELSQKAQQIATLRFFAGEIIQNKTRPKFAKLVAEALEELKENAEFTKITLS